MTQLSDIFTDLQKQGISRTDWQVIKACPGYFVPWTRDHLCRTIYSASARHGRPGSTTGWSGILD